MAKADAEGPSGRKSERATQAHQAEGAPLLEVRGITRRFGETLASDAVSLTLEAGEIHALLGENGAGKSTLVKIIYGVLRPDAGEILLRGKPVRFASPAQARAAGIGMVFQHFSLFEPLTVAENIALALDDVSMHEGPPITPRPHPTPKLSGNKGPGGGAGWFAPVCRHTRRHGAFDLETLKGRIHHISREYGLPLDPDALVADLSVGERQRVEIVRCLLADPDIIILDEPTSVLTPQEARELFRTLKQLAAEGRGILYITHRLEEARELCRRATILRHGRVVAEIEPAEHTARQIARMMVGAEVHDVAAPPREETGAPALHVRDLTLPAPGPFGVALFEISLDVRVGEVVAIAGVAGNGQRELFAALSGERLAQNPGAVFIMGHDVSLRGINERRQLGAAFVPEERLGHACVADMTLTENLLLTRHAVDSDFIRHHFIDYDTARTATSRVIAEYDVRNANPSRRAGALSGGNLQKFIMGRELDRRPNLLVVNQPTWGVDAGAAALIRQELIDLARHGAGVLVISQDLDEIFEVADRIAVISRGELSEARPADEVSREELGLLMAGAHEKRGDTARSGGAP